MTTSTPTALGIDFGAIEGRSEPPKGNADSKLSQQLTAGRELQQLSCRSVLTPEQLEQVEAIARERYPAMLQDRSLLSSFGVESLSGVNACVSRILKEQGKLRIPEVDEFTKQMNDAVNGFRRKYDPTDPKIREAFEGIKRFISGIFTQGRNLLEDLYHDSRAVEQRLDRVAAKLVERKQQLDINVALCDELYVQNEAAIVQLVGVIAIMEQIRDEASAHAGQLQGEIAGMTADTPNRRSKEEELSNVTEFLGDIEIRINEFIQRLYVAWSTSPQVRNIRKISYGLSQRLGLLVQLTVPTLKMTVAAWGTLLQADQAGAVVSAINDANNDALTLFAGAAATSVPKVAEVIQAPSTRPETIMAVAASIVTQNEGLVAAIRNGQQQRAEVVDAIVTAGRTISASSADLSDTVIDLIRRAQRPLELPRAPELPSEVLQAA